MTEKADIYGMGMVFYSLIAGREPYASHESFKLALLKNTRPEIDPSWHSGFMKVCPVQPGGCRALLATRTDGGSVYTLVCACNTGDSPHVDGLNVVCASLILGIDAVPIESLSTRKLLGVVSPFGAVLVKLFWGGLFRWVLLYHTS